MSAPETPDSKPVIRVKTLDDIPDGYDAAKSDILYVLEVPSVEAET